MSRLLAIVAGAVLVIAGLIGLLAFANTRDDAGLENHATAGPGTYEPASAKDPPTSGPHNQRNVTGERSVSDDALLTALELGDVVIAYPQPQPPAALERLQTDLTGPFDAELAAVGQMLILVHRDDVDGVQALAWQRRLEATGPDDPRLRAFAEAWLGKGRDTPGA